MGGSAGSKTTAGIALRVIESHKPHHHDHHHDKVETPLGGAFEIGPKKQNGGFLKNSSNDFD
jgi:hypothetical protein